MCRALPPVASMPLEEVEGCGVLWLLVHRPEKGPCRPHPGTASVQRTVTFRRMSHVPSEGTHQAF